MFTVILIYLVLTFILGVAAQLLCISGDEAIGILYERKHWDGWNDTYVTIVLTYSYIVTFSYAICYWIYRLCTKRMKK